MRTRVAEIGIPDQRWRTLVKNVHAEKRHFDVSIDDPVQLEVLVIVSERVDELFAELWVDKGLWLGFALAFFFRRCLTLRRPMYRQNWIMEKIGIKRSPLC